MAGPVQRLDKQLVPRLEHWQQQQRYRRRSQVTSQHGMVQVINGQTRVNFSSNDYLGLANDPRTVYSFREAAKEYGVGSGASHLITGHTHAHHALEEEIAEFLQRPRALLFSTGFMANLGISSALTEKSHCLITDRLNHASLVDAARMSAARVKRYLHADVDSARRQLDACTALQSWIVTDGVFSMDGDLAPLADLARISAQSGAHLWVDDAHGFGVLGKHGRGSLELLAVDADQVPVLMCTLGKALGTAGAVVAGSEAMVETLIQAARTYLYTTAMPPAIAAASLSALRILREENWRRDKLNTLIQRFCRGLESLGISLPEQQTPIIPIILGSDSSAVEASRLLAEQGFQVSAIRPPTVPNGSARLRVTLSAGHDNHQVDALLTALARILH